MSNYISKVRLPNSTDDLLIKDSRIVVDENGKIALANLPDVILGQLLYGGTWVPSTQVATLSTNAKTKLGTTSSTITLTNNTTETTGYKANEGIYYICSADGTIWDIEFKVGDWLLSTGSSWAKIDNTDAVTSVNGHTGAVTGLEETSNKVSSWSATTDNTHYPGEKLVKDSLDTKVIEAGAGTNSAVQIGLANSATGTGAIAVNGSNAASGEYSLAEGSHTRSTGRASHAEGNTTLASGDYSHAEGAGSGAIGVASHAEGNGTSAQNFAEHAEGSHNVTHVDSEDFGSAGNTIHSIGIGTGLQTAKNAVEVMQNGDVYILGVGGYNGSDIVVADTVKEVVDNKINEPDLEGTLGQVLTTDGNGGRTWTDVNSNILFEIHEDEDTGEYISDKTVSELYNEYTNNNKTLVCVYDTINIPLVSAEQSGRTTTLIFGIDNVNTFQAAYTITGEYNSITSAETWSLETLPISSGIIDIEYDELMALRDDSLLVPGQNYRITDYVTTTVQSNTRSAGHAFDLIVLATSSRTLDSQAKAINHNGDTYFSQNNADLSKWQIWYDIENDTNKYAWADSAHGKGVIYRMIDEWGNDCPYDFKNILFMIGEKTQPGTYDGVYYYTFSYAYDMADTSVDDYSFNGSLCHNNVIKNYFNEDTLKITLNANVFRNVLNDSACFSNTFESDCYKNTFGSFCADNTFEGGCYENMFGILCYGNTFGIFCYGNTFENICFENTFRGSCYDNTFGSDCATNTFGTDCYNNTFGSNCSDNTFEYACSNNTLGNNCSGNTFGNNCQFNTFGDSSEQYGNYCQYNILENGCQYIRLYNALTASNNQRLQNITVCQGVLGTYSSYIEISSIARNLGYQTKVAKNSNGDLKIYCEADLIQ